MKPLLQITSVPFKYELSVEHARLQINQENIRAEMSLQPSKLDIQTQPVQMRLDTFEYRRSVGLKSVRGSNEELAQIGKRAATQSIGEYGDFGNQIMHIEKGGNIPDTAFSQYFRRATEGNLVFVPTSPMEISWTDGGTQLNYQPTKLNTKWEGAKAQVEYVPGSITMNIQQYPSLNIEYVGGFNYVPRSADPDYVATA